MKIKNEYVLKSLGDNLFVIVNQASSYDLSKMISVNETGAYIFNLLKKNLTKADILKSLVNEYDVNELKANEDFDLFINKLRSNNILE